MKITCDKIDENLTKIKQNYSNKKFRPYIDYIYFPYFKNLTSFTRIEFNFPITVLIGANGTNKSSILKALEACCPNISLGNRWFSTHIDPIRHRPNLPCFVYGYIAEKKQKEIEAQVLYAKPFRKNDPDYWETAKFTVKYKMNPLPTDPKEIVFWGLEKQRWPKIVKPKPIYITFRDSISAFDKFYYYGDSNPGKSNIKKRRQTIRSSSKTLNNVINKNIKHLEYNRRNRISENTTLDEQGLKYVSYILSTKYTEIKLVRHTFYNCEGYTCKFTRNSINYSEAFAGSGEFVVIRIVKEILEAENKTLVLLDEPEVSLHPGAQEKLLEFIVEQTLRKNLQVVIATHSPSFIRRLPDESIKVLINDPITDETKLIKQSCSPNEAFHYIGEPILNDTTFIVEDILAKELVKFSLKDIDSSIKDNINFKFYTGGAFDILNNSGISNALVGSTKIFILLDGDQKKEDLPDVDKLTNTELLTADILLNKFSGGELQIPKDSNESNEIIIERNKKLLSWFKKYVLFLPTNLNPEGFIWTKTTSPLKNHVSDISLITNYKEKIKKLAEELYPSTSDVSSDRILDVQLMLLKGIPSEDQDLKQISDIITKAYSSNT